MVKQAQIENLQSQIRNLRRNHDWLKEDVQYYSEILRLILEALSLQVVAQGKLRLESKEVEK